MERVALQGLPTDSGQVQGSVLRQEALLHCALHAWQPGGRVQRSRRSMAPLALTSTSRAMTSAGLCAFQQPASRRSSSSMSAEAAPSPAAAAAARSAIRDSSREPSTALRTAWLASAATSDWPRLWPIVTHR